MKNNNRTWEALSMKDRASFIKLAIQNGYRDLDSIRNLYNDRMKLLDRIDSTSNADFVKRIQDPNREVLKNSDGTVSTHELSWRDDGRGNAVVYPTVQSTSKGLQRFEDQEAYERAIQNRDTLQMTSPEADWYTKNYKKYAPRFNEYGDGGPKKSFWNYVTEGAMDRRDARTGAVGARLVRDLHNEGKHQEAQDLAKTYAKANVAGMSLAGGYASPSLLGDLITTTGTTFLDTFIDGNYNNLGKNLATNIGLDVLGNSIKYLPGTYKMLTSPQGTAISKGFNTANSINQTPLFGSINNNSNKRNFEIFNNFTNSIQSIYQKSPLYSFLHSPSKIGTYLLNKNFPEADRIKLWNQAVDYNNNQRIAFGYEPLSFPYNKDVIKAADRIDDFLNLFGLKKFATGRGKATAWASGYPINNMDIRFTSPYLWYGSKQDIMGTAAHELRHGIQHTFDYGRPTIFMQNQPRFNDFALPRELRGRGLSPAAQILFNSRFTPNRINWTKSLNEFDAEMAKHRYNLDLNIPYHEWNIEAKQMVQKSLAQRFGISPIEADAIAYDLSTHGYALGGPLYNEDNPIEGFQGNPYIPIVRY